MDDTARIDSLALRFVRGLGDRSRRLIADHYGSATEAWKAGPSDWRSVVPLRGGAAWLAEVRPDREAAAKALGEAKKKGFWTLFYGEPEYPELLAEIYDPPYVLFGVGKLDGPERARVAMVGSRRATTHAKAAARALASELCSEGLCVVSGLAQGIDTEAHIGAVEAKGRTIAVLGSGLDVLYPRQNDKLALKIVETGGAVITEHAPGVAPEAQNFPRRNRIISGLSGGVVIVEAAKKSGSLITAAYALEQGREVLAMPGMARSVSAQGGNNLLREGAALAETAEDVLGALSLPSLREKAGQRERALPLALEGDAAKVLEVLEEAPLDIDTLAARAGLGAAAVGAALMELALAGNARQWPGNRFSLTIG